MNAYFKFDVQVIYFSVYFEQKQMFDYAIQAAYTYQN